VDKNEDRMEKDIGEDGGDTDEEEEEADKPNGSASEDEVSKFALAFSLL